MTDSRQSRRDFVRTTGIVATTGALGSITTSGLAASYQVDREHRTILDGTGYETSVHTIDSPNSARTAVVLGGMHGNEIAGIEAAHLATEYTIDRGTLVVIPEANKRAVENGHNHGPEGDFNRKFPVGRKPTTTAAQGIWNEILRIDPEFIIDMHNATGIFGISGIGQAILPTSGVIEHAENTARNLNEEYIRSHSELSRHTFEVGDTISTDRPLLIHKAAGDQNIAGWLTEVTRTDLEMEERIFLHDMMTRKLLRQTGIDVISSPAITNPL